MKKTVTALGAIAPIKESELNQPTLNDSTNDGTILGMDNMTQIKVLLLILVILSFANTIKSN